MIVQDGLDAAVVHRWARLALTGLERTQEEIDSLNVFPIPDRDTGTNMASTVRSAVLSMAAVQVDAVDEVLAAMAGGAVLGARGNSGVILAQLLRGLATAAEGRSVVDAVTLKAGLAHAVDGAYAAVGDPIEGTILTVARGAAAAAAVAPDTVTAVAGAALTGARTALAGTTEQLDALRAAGVVDAGGRGLVVVLESLVEAVRGGSATNRSEESAPERDESARTHFPPAVPAPARPDIAAESVVELSRELTSRGLTADADGSHADGSHADGSHADGSHADGSHADGSHADGSHADGSHADVSHAHGSHAYVSYAYEVQYLLEGAAADVETLGLELSRLGDSVAIADGGDGQWNVHVHVDDVGAAIEAGIRAGRPFRVEVTRFADQLASKPAPGVGLVAIGPEAGLAQVFAAQGVRVVNGGTSGRPCEDDVLAAVEGCGTGSVILLPDPDQPGDMVERVAARARSQGIVVAVLPTRSAVQALAAVAVHDASRRFEDDVIRMAESAAATRWSEVSVADGEALTSAGRCQAGDVLGLIAGEVVVIGSDPVAVGLEIAGRLLGVGGELVTVLLGGASPAGAGEALSRGVARIAPHAEVDIVAVGQPGRVLSIGVE